MVVLSPFLACFWLFFGFFFLPDTLGSCCGLFRKGGERGRGLVTVFTTCCTYRRLGFGATTQVLGNGWAMIPFLLLYYLGSGKGVLQDLMGYHGP